VIDLRRYGGWLTGSNIRCNGETKLLAPTVGRTLGLAFPGHHRADFNLNSEAVIKEIDGESTGIDWGNRLGTDEKLPN
jgi:hypothetical protein